MVVKAIGVLLLVRNQNVKRKIKFKSCPTFVPHSPRSVLIVTSIPFLPPRIRRRCRSLCPRPPLPSLPRRPSPQHLPALTGHLTNGFPVNLFSTQSTRAPSLLPQAVMLVVSRAVMAKENIKQLTKPIRLRNHGSMRVHPLPALLLLLLPPPRRRRCRCLPLLLLINKGLPRRKKVVRRVNLATKAFSYGEKNTQRTSERTTSQRNTLGLSKQQKRRPLPTIVLLLSVDACGLV